MKNANKLLRIAVMLVIAALVSGASCQKKPPIDCSDSLFYYDKYLEAKEDAAEGWAEADQCKKSSDPFLWE